MTENIIEIKTYDFALKLSRLILQVVSKNKEYVISRQLIKSGTSIGANVVEAQGAQTSKDFLLKISISYKEALETKYWIRLYKDLEYLNQDDSSKLVEDVEEILRILSKIKISTREKIRNEK